MGMVELGRLLAQHVRAAFACNGGEQLEGHSPLDDIEPAAQRGIDIKAPHPALAVAKDGSLAHSVLCEAARRRGLKLKRSYASGMLSQQPAPLGACWAVNSAAHMHVPQLGISLALDLSTEVREAERVTLEVHAPNC